MKKILKLKNIGKLSEAEIYLEGITVICGENNSGKSTVGKALYNVFYSFANSEEKAENQKAEKIGKEFDEIHKQLMFTFKKLTPSDKTFSESDFSIVKNDFKNRFNNCNLADIDKTVDEYFEECISLFKVNYLEQDRDFSELNGLKNISKSEFTNLCNISTEDIVKDIISVQTEKIFHGQLVKIPCDEAYIDYHDDMERNLEIKYSANDKCTEINQSFIVNSDNIPVYIGNPYVIDLLNNNIKDLKGFFKSILSPADNYIYNYIDNKKTYMQLFLEDVTESLNRLKDILFNFSKDFITLGDSNSRIDIIQTDNKITKTFEELNKLLNGKFITNGGDIRFKENNIEVAIDVRNLSTGLKSMAVIERCLSLGIIKEGTTLILDEPEIHLHPEWQLKYAEFIIFLQKALNLTVLITTHSPQFLRAIECYMDNYDVMDRLNVYSIENEEVINASYSEYGISEIYDKLSRPYSELQQMLDEKYGECDD